MLRICFVCLGNICRSPMAEMIMKDKLTKLNIKNILVDSKATSYEEQGNDIHNNARTKLLQENIKITSHKATRLEKEDYNKYDYFICMEESNIRNTLRIFNLTNSDKVIKLLSKDIADPWYTGNFDDTYNDLNIGIDKLIEKII